MKVVKDLAGGTKPAPMNLFYNGDYDIDSTTLRYKGSMVKMADHSNAEGLFLTFAGDATAYEGLFGILEEQTGTSGNYMASDALYAMVTKKITPCLPSTVIRGEYAQSDPAGTTLLDNGFTCSAGSATAAQTLTNSAAMMAGGWYYFVTGANANYLHYVEQNTTSALTLGTACGSAVVTGDTCIVIQPANCFGFDLCPHEVHIKSEPLFASRLFRVVGLMHYISDVGIPFQRLDRAKHDGLKLINPQFFHDFVLGGSATTGSVFRDTVVYA